MTSPGKTMRIWVGGGPHCGCIAALLLAILVLPFPTCAHTVYDLDNEITFNVLDQVEYDPKTGKIALIGHHDPSYGDDRAPYLQYLATLLDSPSPDFSLEWTSASEARVDELHNRLRSPAEARKLIAEWGTWID